MRILLTGAGGFGGRHLVTALLAAGLSVTATRRRGYDETWSSLVESLPPVAKDRLDLAPADLAQPETYCTLPAEIDAVVHLAARSPAPGLTAADMDRDNVVATRYLINYAVRAGARTFVHFSTLSVHGRIETELITPETPSLLPDDYGLSKLLAEHLVAEAPLPSFAIRLPGIIGPGSVRNWLSVSLKKARRGEDISIFNADEPFNNAVHIADLAEFVVGLLERGWEGHHAAPVGAAGSMTARAAAETIIAGFGNRSRLIEQPALRPAFRIDISLAQSFGYAPMEISAMIERFVAENRGFGV